MFKYRQSSLYNPGSHFREMPISRKNASSCCLIGLRALDQHSAWNSVALRVPPGKKGIPSTTGGEKRMVGGFAYGTPRYATIRWMRNIFIYMPINWPCSGMLTDGGSRAASKSNVKLLKNKNHQQTNRRELQNIVKYETLRWALSIYSYRVTVCHIHRPRHIVNAHINRSYSLLGYFIFPFRHLFKFIHRL